MEFLSLLSAGASGSSPILRRLCQWMRGLSELKKGCVAFSELFKQKNFHFVLVRSNLALFAFMSRSPPLQPRHCRDPGATFAKLASGGNLAYLIKLSLSPHNSVIMSRHTFAGC